jgi:hypothetical protein
LEKRREYQGHVCAFDLTKKKRERKKDKRRMNVLAVSVTSVSISIANKAVHLREADFSSALSLFNTDRMVSRV